MAISQRKAVNDIMHATLMLDAKAELGECPVWDAGRQVLHFVDINAGLIHTYNPAIHIDTTIPVGEPVGCIALARVGLIAALKSGVALLGVNGEPTYLAEPEHHLPNNRPNDGKCDPVGRFIWGTMKCDGTGRFGSLYSLNVDREIGILREGVGISNGLAWSPDGTVMYYVDTQAECVIAYDYDVETGGIRNGRQILSISPTVGLPDGLTVDSEGMLWVAIWGGGCVWRVDPTARNVLEWVTVPAPLVTSCTFGGEDLSTLFITTSCMDMSAEALRRHPHAGGVFAVEPGVKGLPAVPFGGFR